MKIGSTTIESRSQNPISCYNAAYLHAIAQPGGGDGGCTSPFKKKR